jgi:HD domain
VSEATERARTTAESLLAPQLPRRWRHVQAVAARAAELAETVPRGDRSLLVSAAWLHDIGYSPGLVDTGLHAFDGARWLIANKFGERLASLVAYHSCAVFEAEERNIADLLTSEFSPEDSAVTDALWCADMTTGPDGQRLDVADRLAEIRQRYGPEDVVTRFWERAEPTLLTAVARAEARQPM